MTSKSIYGSARNSLVWLGVAESTHRASERVRGSGRGGARQGGARRRMAGHGMANTQRPTGRCSLLGEAKRGKADQGGAGRGKHTAAYGLLQFARRGQVWHGAAKQSRAWRGRDVQTHSGPRAVAVCSEQPGTAARCWALPGRAKSSLVNTQRLPGRCSLLGSDRNGFAWLCCAGRGTARHNHPANHRTAL